MVTAGTGGGGTAGRWEVAAWGPFGVPHLHMACVLGCKYSWAEGCAALYRTGPLC